MKTNFTLRPARLVSMVKLLCWFSAVTAAVQVAQGGDKPFITVRPASQYAVVGTTVQWSVTATGSPPLFYQWQWKNTNIAAANESVYSLFLNSTNQRGYCRVIVSNTFGSVTSSPAFLSIREPLRFLTTQGTNSFSNGFNLRMAGGWQPYAAVIEGSTDLHSWSPLYTNPLSGGVFSFADSNSPAQPQRFYRASARLPLSMHALAATGPIDLNGNNIATDSFDSSDPIYSTAGRYDAMKRKVNGDVATTAGIVNSLSIGNAKINGRVHTGLGGSVAIGPDGSVGDLAWFASGHTGAQPGYILDDFDVIFPDVPSPPIGGMFLPPDFTLGNGVYQVTGSLSLSGSSRINVTGTNSLLYVTGNLTMSGLSTIVLSPGASLALYVGGPTASLGGSGIVNPGQARNFIYYGLPGNTSLSMTSIGQFTGVIYAPQADLALGGVGGTNNFSGAAIAKTISLNGNYSFHYDEALGKSGPMH